MKRSTVQSRRLRIWSASPVCAKCQCRTSYPYGFELHRRVPLCEGGTDDDANLQVQCAGACESGAPQLGGDVPE